MFITIQCTPRSQATSFVDVSSDSHFIFENAYVSFSLRKRAAYPRTYCRISPDKRCINFGYADHVSDISHDFLHGTLNAQGEISLQRDALATLPLFYAEANDTLYISNNYLDVAQQLPAVSLRSEVLSELLSGIYFAPPLNEVSYLGSYQTLKFNTEGISVCSQPDSLLAVSAEAPPSKPRDFSKILAQYLDYFIATRVSAQTCYEVSGGLDSALLPQYIAYKGPAALHFAVLRFHDSHFGSSQQAKLDALMQKTGGVSHEVTLDARAHLPLQGYVYASPVALPFLEGPYHAAVCELLDKMRDQGFAVICTGQGGDELFGNFVTPGEIISGMPLSVQKTKLTNNVYIERDLWPVSPFMDPTLFRWIQGLPAHFRYDRKIMAAFHKAHNFVEVIYNPAFNENFGTFIIDCMKSGHYDTTTQDFVKHSELATLGITDPYQYAALYKKIQEQTYDNATKADDATEVYSWFLAEITARFRNNLL